MNQWLALGLVILGYGAFVVAFAAFMAWWFGGMR